MPVLLLLGTHSFYFVKRLITAVLLLVKHFEQKGKQFSKINHYIFFLILPEFSEHKPQRLFSENAILQLAFRLQIQGVFLICQSHFF